MPAFTFQIVCESYVYPDTYKYGVHLCGKIILTINLKC